MEPSNTSSYSNKIISSSHLERRIPKFEGFDFLRAIFCIAIIAYKTKIFYLPKLLFPSALTIGLSDYILSGMVGALAVPVFLQISLFVFQLKNDGSNLNYFLKKRLPRLITLYLFWLVSITVFDLLFVDGLGVVRDAIKSPKSLLLFIVSGNNTPYFFFFSLLFVTIISEILVLLFNQIKTPLTQLKVSYGLLIASSILLFGFATVQPLLHYTGIQSSMLKGLGNLTGWDYNPLNFLPYVFSTAITAQEYRLGKLDQFTSSLRRKLFYLAGLTLICFGLEWGLTSSHLLIQVDQAPLDHYMRLSLVFGSWFLLYATLLMKQKPPAWIRFLASCSLGIYGFHVFFAFKRPWPLESIPVVGGLFETFPNLKILTFFCVTLLGTILLTVISKKSKLLREFV